MATPEVNHVKAAEAYLAVDKGSMAVQEYMVQAAQAHALTSIAKSLEEIVKILKVPGVR